MGRCMTGLTEQNLPMARKIARFSWLKFNRQFEQDDMQQEAALALVRAERAFQPQRGVKFSTLGFVSCKNAMTAFATREMRHRRKFRRRDHAVKAFEPAIGFTVDAKAVWGGTQRVLHRLTNREREVFLSLYRDQMQPHEVAEQMGCTRQRVQQLHKSMLKRLRLELGLAPAA
jgi:RNA polymerase sigma factor (sigma-70 family)